MSFVCDAEIIQEGFGIGRDHVDIDKAKSARIGRRLLKLRQSFLIAYDASANRLKTVEESAKRAGISEQLIRVIHTKTGKTKFANPTTEQIQPYLHEQLSIRNAKKALSEEIQRSNNREATTLFDYLEKLKLKKEPAYEPSKRVKNYTKFRKTRR